jgi:hypothetical protein
LALDEPAEKGRAHQTDRTMHQGACAKEAAYRAQVGMDAEERRQPMMRLAIWLPVLLLCSVCAVVVLHRPGGSDNRHVELLSAIDEYLEGKYGTGGTQSLGQLNRLDHTGYSGEESVAKEFGLSDNDPLVQKWDQDQTMDSMDDSAILDSQEAASSVPARAAAAVGSVLGEPVHESDASHSVDAREAAMAAAGAKAVDSVSMAAQRKQMRQVMLKKFEAQAEATTKKVAAQTPDTIGDGTIPSESAYLPLPKAATAAVPVLAKAAKDVVKKAASAAQQPPAAAAPAVTPASTSKALAPAAVALPTKTAVKTAVKTTVKAAISPAAAKATTKPKAPAASTANVPVTNKAGAAVRIHKQARPATKASSAAQMQAQIKHLEAELKAKKAGKAGKAKKLAVPAPPPDSWSGLANMLDSRTPSEIQAADAETKSLVDTSVDSDTDDDAAELANKLLSDPENDLKDDSSPDGPTGVEVPVVSSGDDFNSLYTTLKSNEDPAAAAEEEMYRQAEEKAMKKLNPVYEVYSDAPQVSGMQPLQQLRSVPRLQLAHKSATDKYEMKLKLLHAEVRRMKEQREIKKLETEVASMQMPDTHKPLHVHASSDKEGHKSVLASKHKVSAHIAKAASSRKEGKGAVFAQYEKAREHVEAREADSSEEEVARLRAEVGVMRDRIKKLESNEEGRPVSRGSKARDAKDADVRGDEQLKARQQLLTQFREGALHAGKTSGAFWARERAKDAAAKWKREALSAGAKSYDQVQQLKNELHAQEQASQQLRQELHDEHSGAEIRRGGSADGSLAAAGGDGVMALSARRGAGGQTGKQTWAAGVAEIRREMKGVRRDMDETAGREDAIVGRISQLGGKIGEFMKSEQ